MIKFYYHPAPNPAKVALLLEELGLEYEVMPVDTRKGEQFNPDFMAINPNAKTPALVDGEVAIFDSNAILLYLADKAGRFVPEISSPERGPCLSWLMFVATGIGPYSGQAVHFKHFAPEPKEYAVNRYSYEAERHWGILDKRLATQQYMVGNAYGIVDMAVWGWGRAVPFLFGETAWTDYPNIKRLFDEVTARPAAARAAALATKFTFKTEMDEESKAHMFPQNKRLAAQA